jgi:hypothetical protein
MFIVTSKNNASSGGAASLTKADAAPPELIILSIRYYKHWAPPEPRNGKTPRGSGGAKCLW